MGIKTIFITGSGTGIGKAVAIALAQRGHKVFATTHHQSEADELNKIAEEAQLKLESFVLDVTLAKDREKISKYEVDVLINNAGIGETGSLAEIDLKRVRDTFEVNLFGALELTQLALKSMIKRDHGRVIFVSSLFGRVNAPFFGPYCMTKFALSSGAEMLRNELEQITDNVHVSIVEPGAYHTGFNQKMMEKKYQWMDEKSYFYKIIDTIREKELRQFKLTERKDIASIVAQIIRATEAKKPKLRYVAPWWQGLYVRIVRMFGK